MGHGPGMTDQDQALGRSVAHQTVSSDGIAVCSGKSRKSERQGSGTTQSVGVPGILRYLLGTGASLELLHMHELEATAGLTRHPFCANTKTSNNSLWS